MQAAIANVAMIPEIVAGKALVVVIGRLRLLAQAYACDRRHLYDALHELSLPIDAHTEIIEYVGITIVCEYFVWKEDAYEAKPAE